MPPSQSALERNIRLFYAVRLFRYMQVWVPVWVIYLTVEQGFSLTQVTTADALFFVAITLLEVPTGAFADRWGRGKSVGLGGICLAIALLIFAFTTSYPILLASFMAWALAETLASGADLALLYDSLKELGREHEYEKHAGRGEAALSAGALLGLLLGGPVAGFTSTQTTIFIGVGTTLATALLAFRMVEVNHQAAVSRRIGYLPNLRRALRLALRTSQIRMMLIAGGFLSAGLTSQMYLLQPYIRSNGVEVGWLFSLLQVPLEAGFIVGALVSAALVARFREPRLLVAMGMAGGAAIAIASGSPGLLGIVFLALATTAEGTIRPITTGYINRRVPSDQRATVLSMQSLTTGLFVAPLGPLVGATADANGIRSGYFVVGAVVLVGGAIVTALWLLTNRRAPQPPADGGPAQNEPEPELRGAREPLVSPLGSEGTRLSSEKL